jgi:hypothetical protein
MMSCICVGSESPNKQFVSWLLAAEPQVQSWVTLCVNYGGCSANGESSEILWFFSMLVIISTLLQTHASLLHDMSNSPDQAAHYHIPSIYIQGFL